MCGRYALTSPPAEIAERFGLLWTPEIEPHYNIAPSQMIPVVRETEAGRALVMLKWGLIPWWAKDATIGAKLVNARAETLADKPAFRDAYRRRHCLIPADTFYEWKPVEGRKQPYCIRLRDHGLFGMAGLWERWQAPGIRALPYREIRPSREITYSRWAPSYFTL
jgi:putative SOS response-associated peptidase YedK